ncbi:protein FMC1 homolog [Uranotaenia lowii]|uniref:protein FMC1 homolog n=1 Tax=Uranotaenia lowii TaxID=190385 RepID=UPI00247A686B|nr:protein FMC1 homolog [Uranotaenia lowii]
MAAKSVSSTLKRLLSEIKNISSETNYKDSLAAQYINSQFRKYETTEQQHCRAREEMKFTAETYLCYLSSVRKLKELNETYSGKGERSIRETADMVGFKLPHDPK